jgi:hypothetical protein
LCDMRALPSFVESFNVTREEDRRCSTQTEVRASEVREEDDKT